ncbi:hypothetical protein [Jeotgalibacillus salarius]|uniref:CXXC-20-CXXC protein n=1 Tax=Jeotgalibacillus salarius TaxID=546023 RepID=A0A4Y8LBE7_9BACL|nr:hypothetical protein [Jeotgalibacillus salarius]TFD99494.1 hypothetical protein E2626_14645 [Jeotgalibacillus salarius]
MPRCTNCDTKWKLRNIWKLGFSKDGRHCPVCGKRQYISSESQRMMTIGFWSVLFILIFPFMIKLTDRDEPLW